MANPPVGNGPSKKELADQAFDLAKTFVTKNFDNPSFCRTLVEKEEESGRIRDILRYARKLLGPAYYHWALDFSDEGQRKRGQSAFTYNEDTHKLELWIPYNKISCTLTRAQARELSQLLADRYAERERPEMQRSAKNIREKMLPAPERRELTLLLLPSTSNDLRDIAAEEGKKNIRNTSGALEFGLPLQQAFTAATRHFMEWSANSLASLHGIEAQMARLVASVLPDPAGSETTILTDLSALSRMTAALEENLDALIRDQATASDSLERAGAGFKTCEDLLRDLSKAAAAHAQQASGDHAHLSADLAERARSLGISATTAKMYAVLASKAMTPVREAFHAAVKIRHETLPRLSALALAAATAQQAQAVNRLGEQTSRLNAPVTTALGDVFEQLTTQARRLVDQTRDIGALTETLGSTLTGGIAGGEVQPVLDAA